MSSFLDFASFFMRSGSVSVNPKIFRTFRLFRALRAIRCPPFLAFKCESSSSERFWQGFTSSPNHRVSKKSPDYCEYSLNIDSCHGFDRHASVFDSLYVFVLFSTNRSKTHLSDIFAIIGVEMFRETSPKYFSGIGDAIFALFRLITLDDW